MKKLLPLVALVALSACGPNYVSSTNTRRYDVSLERAKSNSRPGIWREQIEVPSDIKVIFNGSTAIFLGDNPAAFCFPDGSSTDNIIFRHSGGSRFYVHPPSDFVDLHKGGIERYVSNHLCLK